MVRKAQPALTLIAITNSVNLTDGLDGLAGGTSAIFIIGFVIAISAIIKSFIKNVC